MSILHTWGQSLSFHPHLHCIVLGGGLTKDLKFKTTKKDFLFPIFVVSKLFRKKFLTLLKVLYQKNKLVFAGQSLKYRNSYTFKELLAILYIKEWIPHIKETFKGAENVIEYLGRYTHEIAISNSRIIDVKPEGITFSMKNYQSGQYQNMTLDPVEFIRRFLMHVLPSGFVKIRHYGILSNRSKKVKLKICRNLLKRQYQKPRLEGLTSAQILLELFGIDISKCPKCKSNHFRPYKTLHKLE